MRAIEAIENICDEMSNYGESEEEGRKTYVRVRLLAFSRFFFVFLVLLLLLAVLRTADLCCE